MSSKLYDFQSNYERLPWYKKPKNWLLPILAMATIFILLFSTVVEEYYKEVEKHNDVIAAQIECKRNPPKSVHNRQSCWEANLKASRSPFIVALSNTGGRIFQTFVSGLQTIGRSYMFSAIAAIFSALVVLYCISASPNTRSHAMLFPPTFGNFNPYLVMDSHNNSKGVENPLGKWTSSQMNVNGSSMPLNEHNKLE